MESPDNRLSESYHIVLARRMSTWVLLVYSFLFIGILIGFSIAWLNAHKSFLPHDLPLSALELYFCVGLIGFVGVMVFSLIFQPQVMDVQLKLYNTTGRADLDDKLKQLQTFADIQRENGNLCRRVKLFLTNEVQMNALTYGGFLKEARVVFAADMFEAFSDRDLLGILCHELGHVHYGDYFISVAFHYLLRLLDWLLKPFRWGANIIDYIVSLTCGKKKPVIAAKFYRYATLIYAVANDKQGPLIQRIIPLVDRLDDTHRLDDLFRRRIARVGF